METSFFTGFGHFCRFVCVAAFAILSINAKLGKLPPLMEDHKGASDILEFKGEATKYKKVALRWTVATTEQYKYTIEKSRDGEHFVEVDSRHIKAEGTSAYTWIDAYPRNVNCYRLKMTDAKGNAFYSKVLVVQMFRSGQVALVGATPDVAKNDINVILDLHEDAFVTMNITDKDGDIVMQQKERAKNGHNEFSFRGSNAMKPGGYFLNVIVNGDDRLTVRLVKS